MFSNKFIKRYILKVLTVFKVLRNHNSEDPGFKATH